MKRNANHSPVAVAFLMAVLATFPSETIAQNAEASQNVVVPQNAELTQNTVVAQNAVVLQKAMMRAPEKNKGDFVSNNTKVWSSVLALCGTTVDNACANAAIFAASAECEDSAKFFKKSSTGWQALNLILILASASFTAVGASTTIASAKVFSTLGGTTGLGAVGTTINANSAGDQAGLTAVNSTISKLQTFALGTGTPPVPPTANVIFQQARLYGAQCAAAANGSPANNSSSNPSKPASN